MQSPRFLLALASLLGIAACGGSENGTDSAPRYNVVLISMDSVRQDRVGPYGHRPEFAPEIAVTPHLDALASEGVVFDQAWATSSWTLPSHMTMMTGLSDAAHGVVHDYVRMDPQRTTLAEHFSAAGYTTAGFFSGPYLDPKYGFGEGFDFYQSGMMPEDEREGWIRDRIAELEADRRAQGLPPGNPQQDFTNMRDRLSHEDITSPRINEFGLNFLEAHADQPFFLFLHYFDAHYDHIPEKMEPGLGKRFDPEYQGDFSPDRWYFNPQVRGFANGRPQRVIGDRDLRHILAWYDAEIHWVDRHIGQVLSKLDELGLAENTIVAVVSDHGDEFFEHGNIGHRTTLFPEVLKVPWVMKVPGEARAGARIPEVVRLYDLGPTLVDYALGDSLPGAEGTSVRPFVDQAAGTAPFEALGHLTNLQPAGAGLFRAQTQEVWRDGRYSLHRMLTSQPFSNGSQDKVQFSQTLFPGGVPYFAFDRQEDPLEQNPLPPSHPEFKKAVERFQLAVTAHQQHHQSLVESPLEAIYPKAMTEEERQTLIDLGYMDASTGLPDAQLRIPRFAPYPTPRQIK